MVASRSLFAAETENRQPSLAAQPESSPSRARPTPSDRLSRRQLSAARPRSPRCPTSLHAADNGSQAPQRHDWRVRTRTGKPSFGRPPALCLSPWKGNSLRSARSSATQNSLRKAVSLSGWWSAGAGCPQVSQRADRGHAPSSSSSAMPTRDLPLDQLGRQIS